VRNDEDSYIQCHEGIDISSKRLFNLSRVESWFCFSLPELADFIKAVAFAPPPVLDHDSAFAASSYTTSIVNDSDIIRRSSPYCEPGSIFLEFLYARRFDSAGGTWIGTAVNPASSVALIRKLARSVEACDDNDLLMTLMEE